MNATCLKKSWAKNKKKKEKIADDTTVERSKFYIIFRGISFSGIPLQKIRDKILRYNNYIFYWKHSSLLLARCSNKRVHQPEDILLCFSFPSNTFVRIRSTRNSSFSSYSRRKRPNYDGSDSWRRNDISNA